MSEVYLTAEARARVQIDRQLVGSDPALDRIRSERSARLTAKWRARHTG